MKINAKIIYGSRSENRRDNCYKQHLYHPQSDWGVEPAYASKTRMVIAGGASTCRPSTIHRPATTEDWSDCIVRPLKIHTHHLPGLSTDTDCGVSGHILLLLLVVDAPCVTLVLP